MFCEKKKESKAKALSGAFQTVGAEEEKVGLQVKQQIEERQGAWDSHYANSEIMLRKKADSNMQILKKHQVQTQVGL